MALRYSIHRSSCIGMMVAASMLTHAAPARADDALPMVMEHNSIAYVTGGIGVDETAALQAVQNGYNLRILSADAVGHFSGDTRIVVRNAKQATLLDATAGPIFYASLPNGRYIVDGYNNNQSKTQTITIANGKPARVRFVWPQEAVTAR